MPEAKVDDTVAVNVTDAPKVDGLSDEASVVVVEAVFTTCEIALEVLPLKLVSPLYTAVIECVPPVRFAVLKVACPLLSVPVPSDWLPSMNVTIPVAVFGTTVAVNVTDVPNVEGFGDALTDVVLLALVTTCDNAADVLEESLASPPYTAVIECVPPVSAEVLNVACPLPNVPVPRVVEPSLKVTVPVAVLGVTVAVNMTD